MRLNWKMILSIMGLLILINGLFMLLCLPFSFYYDDGHWQGILSAGVIAAVTGGGFRLFTLRKLNTDIKKRDGYLIVSLGWVSMSIFGTLPYLLTGSIPGFTQAFFETMSGYTTTGSTILTNIEILPESVLFWRSLTHWIGGMGIIVLTIAILPFLGIGGMQLFVAESPGLSPDKLHPRITETAKRLWLVYVSLTILETVLLYAGGMSFFDAINHAMSTMATGGFSTKNASIAHFESAFIQYVIILFMILAGTNFTLTFFMARGNFRRAFGNEEFRVYILLILIVTAITTTAILVSQSMNYEQAFRDALFQVVSIVTTTGFITADYTSWATLTTVLFFMLLFTGGSTGSTAGGIKMMRHLLLIKNSLIEFKRQLHPSAIIPVRFNKKVVDEKITYNVSGFILIYILIFFAGSLIMSMIGLDFNTALGASASSLGNIGPGIGNVGPVDNFAAIPDAGQWILTFFMLLGRLELFTVLILLTPYYWNKY